MSRLRVQNIAVSLDGFAAGPSQSLEEPLGIGGGRLHEWAFDTRFFHEMTGQPGGSEGVDNDFLDRGFEGIGAWILGRNMFGPIRGDWPDEEWRGWWGDSPPYHCPVFVLTHHARPDLVMDGGTTFHFVTEGIEVALERAKAAAGDLDVRLGGGAATVQQYLRAGRVDELQFAIVPFLLGSGERLLDGIEEVAGDFDCVEMVSSEAVTHVRLVRRGAST